MPISVDLNSALGFDCGVPLCLGELNSLRSLRLKGVSLFNNISNWKRLLQKRFKALETSPSLPQMPTTLSSIVTPNHRQDPSSRASRNLG